MEYCNFPSGSALADERAANGAPELLGCGGNSRPEAAAEFRHYATFARKLGDTAPFLVGCGPSR